MAIHRGRASRLRDRARERARARLHARLYRLSDEQLARLWWPNGLSVEGPERPDTWKLSPPHAWAVLGEVGVTWRLLVVAVGVRADTPAELVERRVEEALAPVRDLDSERKLAIVGAARRMGHKMQATDNEEGDE